MDAATVNARMGQVYAWASPNFIRSEMSEAQLLFYAQRMNTVEDQRAKANAYHMGKVVGELLAIISKKAF